MGRMSAFHDPIAMTPGVSIPAISTGANTLNGATVTLNSNQRGVYFVFNIGALTGLANTEAYLQTNDLPTDPANGNWTNVNTTTYPNAAVTVKGNGCTDHVNSAWEMSWRPDGQSTYSVRAVRVTAANTAVTSISHMIY